MNRHHLNWSFVFCGMLAALLLMTTPADAADAQSFVYVSAGASKQVLLYHLDRATGELVEKQPFAIDGGPGPQALHPDGKHLYVALRSIKSVATFSIDQGTGKLDLLGITHVINNPVYLHIDRSGKYLLMASFNGNQAAVYPLRQDFIVDEAAKTIIATQQKPHCILTDPSNRYVYIPNMGSDLILQFKFDTERGSLSPLRLPAVTTPAKDGPRHLAFHPTKPWFFVANEVGSVVTSYKYAPEHGGIMAMDRQSTLPADYTGRNTTADVHVTPDGRFVYVSNRGLNSLASFALDEKTGKLKLLGETPTEKTPRAFDISPDGEFLIAAGQNSNRLAVYRINKKTGGLAALKQYDTGKSPAWVLIKQPD